ncbi:kinase-like protein [Imleria badia]|nr:kinase-like protein [Imleria badia]
MVGNDKSHKMIYREVGIWRRLDHKNIVPFLGITHGFGISRNISLVSLWMPNGSLHSFLMQCGDRLTLTHRLQLLLDVANGVSYLHSFPIVHGDLNPNNVLLDADYTARLTDFGYSSILGELPEALHYLQRSTNRPGALRWISPEQLDLELSSPNTTQSDIYSFGNMTLMVLSGQQPWAEVREDAAVVLRLAKGLKPRRPSLRRIEDRHWEFIEKCWSRVESRPPANGVVLSIQRFLSSCPPPQPLHDVLQVVLPARSESGVLVSHDLHEDLLVTPDLTDKIHKADGECIFHGSFSDVYKYLHDSEHGTKEVALKVFRIKFTVGKEWNGSQVGKGMHHTLNTWRTLNHPNIVQFFGIAYGFGRQGNASLVSLWMPNGSLQVFLDRHDYRLMIAHRLQLLLDAASGLQYLHSIPIIHGDLSPNNILLDDNYNARLTDFDYASFIGNRDVYLAASTLRGGALRWTAPELIAEGKPEHTTKNDIYPFGNLAYLVLSGQYPWSEIRQDAVVLLRLAEGRKASRPKSPPVDDQHWGLIERCWSPVQDRPPAEAVVHDIQKFLGTCSPPQCLRDLLAIPTTSKTIP